MVSVGKPLLLFKENLKSARYLPIVGRCSISVPVRNAAQDVNADKLVENDGFKYSR